MGKRVLVTGATGSIGRAAVEDLDNLGYELVLLGRNHKKLSDLQKSLSNFHEICVIDNNSTAVEFNELLNYSFDGVVCIAGVLNTKMVRFCKPADYLDMFQINTFFNMNLVSYLLKNKKINPNSSFVFVTSISVDSVDIGNTAYSASKSALKTFSKSLAAEIAKTGSRSNCIEPGFIPSALTENTPLSESIWEAEKKRYLLGFGKPSYISGAIRFLLSDDAFWMTGQNVRIDGGATLR